MFYWLGYAVCTKYFGQSFRVIRCYDQLRNVYLACGKKVSNDQAKFTSKIIHSIKFYFLLTFVTFGVVLYRNHLPINFIYIFFNCMLIVSDTNILIVHFFSNVQKSK